jgi:ATP-dependent Lhr-like helicase
MSDDAFSRLAPFVREYIYEKKWTLLREIQEAAIREVFDGDGHIRIAASTASGKTEAVFFPVISQLRQTRPASVGALYISPLKALITDQFDRLSALTDRAELPLWRWHGDVSENHKKKLLENPRGILQITPESLEALLLRSPQKIRILFRELSFVIIDEVHAFMGSGRGGQILCQLARIEETCLCRPRRVGLSATLGDYRGAMKWLARGSGRSGSGGSSGGTFPTALIREEKTRRRVSVAVDYFSSAKGEGAAYWEALSRQTRGRRNIIFTNSRLEAEETIGALRNLSRRGRRPSDPASAGGAGVSAGPDRFYIHHGSISASLRAETERELRESPGPLTAAATATLEMGIDIGGLDRVIQIGAPFSVSAFVQRLGRSGRRRGKPEIYFTHLEEKRRPVLPTDTVPWPLLKIVAIIELYLGEKWIEEGGENPLPLSLLCHQTLSILASLGEHSPAALAERVLSLPGFAGIGAEDFRELLIHLERTGIIEKTGEGGLITGLGGERLTAHYSFYSVFAENTEYRVLAGGREIGRVNFIPPPGSAIVLGGRYWRVDLCRQREREITVSPGEAGSLRIWRGGGVELHPVIARRMRRVLSGETAYPYLSPRARTRLEEARTLAREWGLTEDPFIPLGDQESAGKAVPVNAEGGPFSFILLPWLGSRAMRTLQLILQRRDYRKTLGLRTLSRENDYAFFISSALPVPAFREALANIISGITNIEALIDPAEVPLSGKFDELLPPRLLVKQYAANMLDTMEPIIRGLG